MEAVHASFAKVAEMQLETSPYVHGATNINSAGNAMNYAVNPANTLHLIGKHIRKDDRDIR